MKDIKLKEKLKLLQKEKKMYENAYNILSDYIDSISDEERPKVYRRLNKIFKIKV